MIGLPGTGLGGLFYALLILWIIVREGWFTILGGGRIARWRSISRFAFLLALILMALSAQAGIVAWFMDSRAFEKLVAGDTTPEDLLTPGLTIGSVFVLIGIFAGLQMLRLRLALVRQRGRPCDVQATASPHEVAAANA